MNDKTLYNRTFIVTDIEKLYKLEIKFWKCKIGR